jgi:hypothetical protein
VIQVPTGPQDPAVPALLQMAEQLADDGCTDAAAALLRAKIELHLRNLCAKHTVLPGDAKGIDLLHQPADFLNGELAAARCYAGAQRDLSAVHLWLQRLKEAFKGSYHGYSATQIGHCAASVREFIARNPAPARGPIVEEARRT